MAVPPTFWYFGAALWVPTGICAVVLPIPSTSDHQEWRFWGRGGAVSRGVAGICVDPRGVNVFRISLLCLERWSGIISWTGSLCPPGSWGKIYRCRFATPMQVPPAPSKACIIYFPASRIRKDAACRPQANISGFAFGFMSACIASIDNSGSRSSNPHEPWGFRKRRFKGWHICSTAPVSKGWSMVSLLALSNNVFTSLVNRPLCAIELESSRITCKPEQGSIVQILTSHVDTIGIFTSSLYPQHLRYNRDCGTWVTRFRGPLSLWWWGRRGILMLILCVSKPFPKCPFVSNEMKINLCFSRISTALFLVYRFPCVGAIYQVETIDPVPVSSGPRHNQLLWGVSWRISRLEWTKNPNPFEGYGWPIQANSVYIQLPVQC